ncbi:MAG: GNAT family N-acetyltransferase [bacterium]
MLTVTQIGPDDDLERLTNQINQAAWDEANEISNYDPVSLAAYIDCQDTLFVVCHDVTTSGSTLMGMASCRFEIKPYGQERWLYVDEVDVCADQRQKGAGKAIMLKLIELAEAADCEEVWLGTEADNDAANALYRSLKPDDIGEVVGYTFEIS